MAVINKIFILLLLIQTGLAGTVTYILFKEGAYISMGIQSALIFLSVVISFMTFWTNSLKYLYMYIITMLLWLVLEVFLFLDIFGIFHVLDSLDDLIIGTTAKNNYKNNTNSILSLTSYLFMGLLASMLLGTIVSCFIKLTKTVKKTDEYGNVYRSSKVVSIIGPGEKKTRFASQVNIIGNNEMEGDPGITVIPNNNNYFNSLNFKKDSRRKDIDYNNYNKLQNDSPSSFLGGNSPPMSNNTDYNYNSLRRVKNDNQLNVPKSRYNEDYYSIMQDRSNTDVKFTTLSHGVKPEAPRSILKQEDDANRSSTWDRSVSSRRGHEAREKNERARNRERIRERERERMRDRSRNRDRERGDRTRDRDRRDRGERNRDEDSPRSRSNREKERNNYKRYEDEEEEEKEEKELHPGNISSREELESYLNKSSMSIYLSKSMIDEKNPKFVSMFEIEENASDVDSEEDFTMNHFTIKCKICKKDIPIDEVENHQCESNNIPLINIETEEHKKEMEEKARKEQEEKERKEREEREKKEKEEMERKEKEEKERKEKEEERARQRKQREREREKRREERSRERRRDERSRERKPSVRDRDHDRDRERRRRDKDAEWEQRYNNKSSSDRTKDRERERDRSERRRRKDEEVREGGRYEIIINYDQILNDEVSVKVGDVFEIERIFEDGWCVGTNLSTSKWGAIPINCLNNKQERRRRIQSLYMS
jgi:hypothetical protein